MMSAAGSVVVVWLLALALAGEEVPAPFDTTGTSGGVAGDDPFVEPPMMVDVGVEFVELAAGKADALLAARVGPTTDATDLRKAAGEAGGEVVAAMMVTARSGEKSASGAGEELIYPTDFGPAEGNDGKTAAWAPGEFEQGSLAISWRLRRT